MKEDEDGGGDGDGDEAAGTTSIPLPKTSRFKTAPSKTTARPSSVLTKPHDTQQKSPPPPAITTAPTPHDDNPLLHHHHHARSKLTSFAIHVLALLSHPTPDVPHWGAVSSFPLSPPPPPEEGEEEEEGTGDKPRHHHHDDDDDANDSSSSSLYSRVGLVLSKRVALRDKVHACIVRNLLVPFPSSSS